MKMGLAERYTLRNQEGRELCDAITAILVDLSQASEIAKNPVNEMSVLEQWDIFFALGNQPKYSGIIKEITQQQEGIAVANEVLQSISQDPDERARYRSRRIWLRDREHEYAVMKEEGRREAYAEYEQLLANRDAEIANMKAELANKDAELKALRS